MTMNECVQKVTDLKQIVRNRDGVSNVIVSYTEKGGMNRNNQIVDRPVFQVKLLPAQKDELGKATFRDFFWKEAGKLELSSEVVSLVIDDKEDPMWDPQV